MLPTDAPWWNGNTSLSEGARSRFESLGSSMNRVKYNFSVPPERVEAEWTVWPWVEKNKHTWAFVYYLKRRGDKVLVGLTENRMRVAVKRLKRFKVG